VTAFKVSFTSELAGELSTMITATSPSGQMTKENLTQYIAMVDVLTIIDTIYSTLCSYGYQDVCLDAKIQGKVLFLMEMLKSRQAIWMQQTAEFSALLKDLLLAVSLEVKTRELNQSSLSQFFWKMVSYFSGSASEQLDIIDHSVPVGYHLLKDAWRKCIYCKHLNFRSRGSAEVCESCGRAMLVSKPEF
jgi:hypothetical protein